MSEKRIEHWPRVVEVAILGQRNGVTKVREGETYGYVQGLVGVPGGSCVVPAWRVSGESHALHATLREKFHRTEVSI